MLASAGRIQKHSKKLHTVQDGLGVIREEWDIASAVSVIHNLRREPTGKAKRLSHPSPRTLCALYMFSYTPKQRNVELTKRIRRLHYISRLPLLESQTKLTPMILVPYSSFDILANLRIGCRCIRVDDSLLIAVDVVFIHHVVEEWEGIRDIGSTSSGIKYRRREDDVD
jgi:hypothetical protein